MKMYNKIIDDILHSIEDYQALKLDYDKSSSWKRNKDYVPLFKKDCKIELGANPYKSVNINCVTSDEHYFQRDEIYLIGDDIKDISDKCNYVRINLIQVDDMPNKEEEIYKEIKNIEFVKYNIFLDGVMIRTSSLDKTEQIRVSKQAIDKGFSFKILGSEFINSYKKNSLVKNVKIIFITEDAFDVNNLIDKSNKNEEITRALNTVLHGMNLDCQSCNLKPICDEVEGMRELHFSKK